MDVEEVNLVLEFSGAMGSREWRLDDSLVSELEGLGLTVGRSARGACAASALARILVEAGLKPGVAPVGGSSKEVVKDLKGLRFDVEHVDFIEEPLGAADEIARVLNSGDLTVVSLEGALTGLVVATALSAVRRPHGGEWVLDRVMLVAADPESGEIVGSKDFLRAWVFLDALASCVGQASEVDVRDVVGSGFEVPEDVRKFVESLTLGHPGYSGSLTWEIEEDSWVPYLDLMIQKVRPEGRRIELKTPGVVSAMLHVMASLGDDRLEEGTAEDDKRS